MEDYEDGEEGDVIEDYEDGEEFDGDARDNVDVVDANENGLNLKDPNSDDITVEDALKMTFDTVDGADAFYNIYSWCLGFSVRRGNCRIDEHGITRSFEQAIDHWRRTSTEEIVKPDTTSVVPTTNIVSLEVDVADYNKPHRTWAIECDRNSEMSIDHNKKEAS
ncbi:hypothetical protein M9H77_26297 [Catharanthus roseus]|uniref:Uncharacterized protein n=1 Tax=Catharanthus roseus TaxID=4058 RepID=A0ACC0A9L1_CATRO|nr:hypothetical protein M9H77_26297 [Catharanthus roseus]